MSVALATTSKNRRRRAGRAIIPLATIALCGASVAFAGRAECEAPGGAGQVPANAAGASSNLWAYSDDGGIGPATPLVSKNLTPGTNIAAPAPAVNPLKTITVGAGIIRAGRAYVGSYGANTIGKGAAQQFVNSSCNGPGYASFGSANFLPPSIISPRNRVRADASVAPNAVGSAAAEAIDPFGVVPGEYVYAPRVSMMRLEIDRPGDYANVTLTASDSRSVQPLFQLTVAAEDQLLSNSDLDVKFTHDPSRLNIVMSDSQIQDIVRNAFSVSGGVAMYDNASDALPAFFQGTYLANQSGIVYGDGTLVATSSVPEPASLATLGVTAGLARRRRLTQRAVATPEA